jgi:pimeloyl-ACP methyl ester carboxylesterase
MPLILLVRIFTALVSVLLLAFAAHLVWTWHYGLVVIDNEGVLHTVREEWRLWAGSALFAWSALGRLVIKPLLAKPDHDDESRPLRSEGQTIHSTSGADLYVESVGPMNAPVLIFTHGWSMDSTIWYYAKRDLSREFRLVFWDLPGLGRSKIGKSEISLEAFAEDLKSVIRFASTDRAILIGHSIGGMTIQTLFRDHPTFVASKVAGTVLLNTTFTNPLKTMALSRLALFLRFPVIEPLMYLMIWLEPLAWLGGWQSYLSGSAHFANRLGFGRFVTRSQLEQTTLLSTRNRPGIIARGNLAMFRWDATNALGEVNALSLVLGGTLDIVTKPTASAVIARKNISARLKIVEGVNHMGFLELSQTYNSEIADFARQLSSSGPAGLSRAPAS